jgi:hypothetical protein
LLDEPPWGLRPAVSLTLALQAVDDRSGVTCLDPFNERVLRCVHQAAEPFIPGLLDLVVRIDFAAQVRAPTSLATVTLPHASRSASMFALLERGRLLFMGVLF